MPQGASCGSVGGVLAPVRIAGRVGGLRTDSVADSTGCLEVLVDNLPPLIGTQIEPLQYSPRTRQRSYE